MHPNIVLSEPKEPHFFGQDLYDPSHIKDKRAYLAPFNAASENTRYFCDASVWYLYSQTAAEEIFTYEPDSKILISLRNPFDLIASLHAKHVYEGYQPLIQLEVAFLANCGDRERPKSDSFRSDACYLDVVDFVPQIKRYLNRFERPNIHIVLFEDFKADPHSTSQSILNFLGLPFVENQSVPELNKGMKQTDSLLVRSVRGLNARFANQYPRSSPGNKIARRVENLMRRADTRLPPPPLSQDMKHEIKARLEPSLGALEDLLGRSLEHWLQD